MNKNIRNISWYMGMSFIVKLFSFVLLPIYSNVFTVEDYGKLATIESLLRFLPVLFSLSIESSVYRYYYENSVCKKTLISSSICFILINSMFISTITYLLISFGIISSFENCGVILVLTAFSSCIAQVSVLLISELKVKVIAKSVAIYTSVLSIAAFIFTILFIYALELSWLSRLYAYSVAVVIQFLCLVTLAKKELAGLSKPSFTLLKEQLKYSLPLFPGIISVWTLALFDRLYLQYLDMSESVGIYSMAVQIALAMYIIQDSILQVNSPKLMKSLIEGSLDRNEQKQFFERFIFILLVFNLIFSLFQDYGFMIFMDKGYYEAMFYIPFLMFIHILRGWNRYIYVYISYSKRTRYIGMLGVAQVVIIALLNYMYFPVYGAKFTIISSGTVITVTAMLLTRDIMRYKINVGFVKLTCSMVAVLVVSGVSVLYGSSAGYDFNIKVLILKMLSIIMLVSILYRLLWRGSSYE
ncbi:lipopolysaccharide biosynthesis protein [Vibrio sp. DNB22_19_2]